MDYWILALSWAIFYTTHSVFAASKLKRILKEKLGSAYKWYRLFYSLFSLLLLIGIGYVSMQVPTQKILPGSDISSYFGYMAATFGTIILVKSSKAWSWKEFIGIKEESNTKELIQSGWYARVRHPLYLGIILIFLGYFLVASSMSSLIHLICLLIYLPFGIYFEEKKLLQNFGKPYETYQKNVPALFPKLKK
ncbi:methyltransferase family protein [Algoriphagus algorifonticola]|uniref:methyltransferase family protein n=1 Tax=Algoriphagus algorifonticola TaxID=2593007 RepID=UPI0011A40E8F|nr:isoprenylcysteine carboxylmethyltransferase family protein [Algoriphagus algorifonticola]